jgi:hypothetical protein
MPQIGASTMPAKAASMVPNTNTPRRKRGRLMPSARTISLSCDQMSPWKMNAPPICDGTGSTWSRVPHTRRIDSSITSAAPKVRSRP